MASVKWSDDALKDLARIDRIIATRMLEKIRWFEENFTTVTPEGLHRNLRGLYKLRVGDYRVVYSLHADLILIQAVGHRRDVYNK